MLQVFLALLILGYPGVSLFATLHRPLGQLTNKTLNQPPKIDTKRHSVQSTRPSQNDDGTNEKPAFGQW